MAGKGSGVQVLEEGDTPAPEPQGMGLLRGLTWVRFQPQPSTAWLQHLRAPGFSFHPSIPPTLLQSLKQPHSEQS